MRSPPGRERRTLTLLAEALIVALAGLTVALLANQLSPRGLKLGRDYFPVRGAPAATNAALSAQEPLAGSRGRESAPSHGETLGEGMAPSDDGGYRANGGPLRSTATAPTNGNALASQSPDARTNETASKSQPSTETVASRLQAAGLRSIDRAEALRLFQDPRHDQEQVVFVDARNDRHYQEGHIPDAYPFDRYYPENHLPTVLPVCQQAETIVVYCNGGDCEDSEFAALALRDAGIPVERIGIYLGGMSDWTAGALPIEIGARGSGERPEKAP